MTVVVTHPDGTTETLGPFHIRCYWRNIHYLHTYRGRQLYFPDEIWRRNTNRQQLPAGTPIPLTRILATITNQAQATYLLFTVQQEPIPYAAVAPLPTNYWTRPIYGENNNWYSIAGNWLGLAASTFAATGMYNATGNYNPYTTAPNSAHILWTKPEAFGGIIGGEFGSSETANYYSTSQYEPKVCTNHHARHTLLHSVSRSFNLSHKDGLQ